ncbi:MAG TPA: bifunctional tetrahydrofolate synthase/dihydrofolate synthase [Burkholderiales bacterium]|nr:bifunctional tetrahydrofolate synthase/dihydrofolate synthase [Burkholderiales bacterium]
MPLPPGPASDLASWLSYLERLHPATIELGLERVARVRDRLALAPPFPLITVGGTNGKGSTCAMLESVLKSAGYRVGCYASPHLLRYNERVRIGGIEVADAALVAAFERVEQARGDISLSYFEFGTLAAVLLFQNARLDVAVLEVGLGGRLDAVNAFEPDCAVVVSIGLDHTDYLGPTLGHIGYEKAGIFRAGKPAVVAETEPPATLLEHAQKIGADLHLIDRDFGYVAGELQWQFWDWRGKRDGLPLPALRGRYQLANASAALAALNSLRDRLPVDMGAIRRGLVEVDLPGRFQVVPGRPAVILDVAHNPHAALRLAENLERMRPRGRRLAVFAMLKDKDIEGVIAAVRAQVDEWLVAPLPGARGADLARMREALRAASVTAPVESFASVAAALERARERAGADDKILVFGSFYTVADALRELTYN